MDDIFYCIHSKIIYAFGFLNLIGESQPGRWISELEEECATCLNATTVMLSAQLSVRTPASEVGDKHYTCNDKQDHSLSITGGPLKPFKLSVSHLFQSSFHRYVALDISTYFLPLLKNTGKQNLYNGHQLFFLQMQVPLIPYLAHSLKIHAVP